MEMNDISSKKRIDYIDALKGFAIILVVLGHIADGYSNSTNVPHDFWWSLFNVIYSFHMPLFIVISGFLYEKAYLSRKKSGKKVLAHTLDIAWVYVVFCCFYGVIKIAFFDFVKEDISLSDITSIWKCSIAPFWYLYILIVYYIVFYFLNNIPCRLTMSLLIIINLLSASIPNETSFELHRIAYYAVFFGLGIMISQKKSEMFDFKLSILEFAVAVLIAVILWNNPSEKHLYVIPYVNGIIAFFTIPIIWTTFEKKSESFGIIKKFFVFLGMKSIEIYVFHTMFTSLARVSINGITGKLGLVGIPVQIIWGLIIGIGAPVIISIVLEKTHIKKTVFRPFSEILCTDKPKDIQILKPVYFIITIVFGIGVALFFELPRISRTWHDLGYEAFLRSKIIYAPRDLYASDLINELKDSYMINGLLVCLLFIVVFCAITQIIRNVMKTNEKLKFKAFTVVTICGAIFGVVLLSYSISSFYNKMDLERYYTKEDFVGLNYLSPLSSEIEPKKYYRNLVYIYVGNTSSYSVFEEYAGAPIKVNLSQGRVSAKNVFYNSIEDIQDVLFRKGYKTSAIIPDSSRMDEEDIYVLDRFFYGHNTFPEYYDIESDLDYPDYSVSKINELYKYNTKNIPFMITLFVQDEEEAGRIIDGIKENDYYANTTIALSYEASAEYELQFVNSVEGDVKFENENNEESKIYDRVDSMPTTLVATGFDVSNDILGLGTSLFSDLDTLRSFYGDEAYNEYMYANSAYMNQKYDQQLRGTLCKSIGECYRLNVKQKNDSVLELVFVDRIKNRIKEVDHMEADIWQKEDKSDKKTVVLKKQFLRGTYKAEYKKYDKNIDTFSAEMYMVSKDGLRYPMYSVNNELIEGYTGDLVTFVKKISDKNYTIFISSKDDMSAGILPEEEIALRSIGLKADFKNNYREGYVAVINADDSDDNVIERYGESAEITGVTRDGKEYDLISQGYNSGSDSHLIFDGQDYSYSKRGISILLYDSEEGRIVESAWYDTSVDYRYSHQLY